MATSQPTAPRVGVAAIMFNAKDELLMGKRAGSHGAGKQAFKVGD